jgi:hypothetical protein
MVACSGVVCSGCEKRQGVDATKKTSATAVTGKMEIIAPTTPAEHVYTTRAVVTRLPASGGLYFEAHHEEIPDFVGRDGTVTGMKEMIMDFPTMHPSVDLGALKVGEKVAITFEVRYKSEPRSVITKIERLGADVTLSLGRVQEHVHGKVQDKVPDKVEGR